jgi:hypothetical protein
MDDLYIETKSGTIHIDYNIVEKYHLEKGTVSPFTNDRIVDRFGDFTREEPPKEEVSLNQGDDEIEEMGTGLMMSQSEIIDFTQADDSDIS